MSGACHGGNIERLARESGLPKERILDFSANINPLGPPDWLRSVVGAHVGELIHYPDPDCTALVSALVEHFGGAQPEIVVGNGSAELLSVLPRALSRSRAVIPVPCYADYFSAAEKAGLSVETLPMLSEEGFRAPLGKLEAKLRGDEIVLLGQPNNPTGTVWGTAALRELVARQSRTVFVVDEAFADFVDGLHSFTRARPDNVVVMRSLTKFYAIPGLRLGCAIASAAIVARMRELLPPWSVNTLAQAVGEAAIRDTTGYAQRTREFVKTQREALFAQLARIAGLRPFDGAANFLLVRLDRSGMDARALANVLLRQGIAIRVCDGFQGLDARYFRLAVRTEPENARLCDALRSALGARDPHAAAPARAATARRTPALMVQGTCSGAGKSLLAAAFCRILLDDGYRVAPFKAQNMSLNSFVTRDQGEMGRAQVLQAEACRLEPDVRMNPILLKPNSDIGSQIIVWGRPVGNMQVDQYIRYKPTAFERAKQAYDELAAQHEVMVLEGAGSPAEVNLKRHDIVNMAMARHAEAKVLLVGDIDRGGVFASFLGTFDTLTESERAMVVGFIVNRFRGQASLLEDALRWTERCTKRPVLGVVPYLRNLGLPEEDSVSLHAGALDDAKPEGDAAESVEIAVVELPHISNFTDFDALRIESDVRLVFVRTPERLRNPAALILPGTKNVMGDLDFLRRSGWAEAVHRLAKDRRTEIVGICGGFQMLGQSIADPHGLESGDGVAYGLGLMPTVTTLEKEKALRRGRGRHVISGFEVYGYEIHHGQSRWDSAPSCMVASDGQAMGVHAVGRDDIWGTYLHGVFDADAFRRWFIDRLRIRAGLSPVGYVRASYSLEPALHRLAEQVRASVDIDRLYREIGLR